VPVEMIHGDVGDRRGVGVKCLREAQLEARHLDDEHVEARLGEVGQR
jgi:hypothetical protein